MEHRTLGRTGRDVSVIGLGSWQLGADWGEVSTRATRSRSCTAAVDGGVTFFDTADVYGDGRSEPIIGPFLRRTPTSWSPRRWAAASTRSPRTTPRRTSGPGPTAPAQPRRRHPRPRRSCTARPHARSTPRHAIYDALDEMVDDGTIAAYGVSVETVDDALSAIARPNLASVQIILNVFRQRPLERCCRPRSTPASRSSRGCRSRRGCCQRTYTPARRSPPTTTAPTTATVRRSTWARRSPACHTRSGCGPSRMRPLVSSDAPQTRPPPSPRSRGCDQPPGVSVVIPGARNPEQARANAEAGSVPDLGDDLRHGVQRIYDEHLRAAIHPRW